MIKKIYYRIMLTIHSIKPYNPMKPNIKFKYYQDRYKNE